MSPRGTRLRLCPFVYKIGALWLHGPQPNTNQPVGVGVRHVGWRYRPGGRPFSTPVYWRCRYMEIFVIRRWDPIVSGCHWLHKPQSISNQPLEVGCPHRAWRCRLGGSPYFSLVGRCSSAMEGLMSRGWEPVPPGCGGTSMAIFTTNRLEKTAASCMDLASQ